MDLLESVRSTPGCRVLPPAGQPTVPAGLTVPDDLREFYERCGGVDLYEGADYEISICPPDRLRQANTVILGEPHDDDPSAAWYTVAETPDHEFVSIDLSRWKNGYCYDSFHETHGFVGDMPVIAVGFTQLLERLIANRGDHWYWLQPDFVSIGDAYDA